MREDDFGRHVINILKETREEFLQEAKSLPPNSMFSHSASARVEAIEGVLAKLDVSPWNKKDKYQKYQSRNTREEKGYM